MLYCRIHGFVYAKYCNIIINNTILKEKIEHFWRVTFDGKYIKNKKLVTFFTVPEESVKNFTYTTQFLRKSHSLHFLKSLAKYEVTTLGLEC